MCGLYQDIATKKLAGIQQNLLETKVCNNVLSQVMETCNGNVWVYLGVKTCERFLCFAVDIVKVRYIMLTSLFSLFYVTGECHRFLH